MFYLTFGSKQETSVVLSWSEMLVGYEPCFYRHSLAIEEMKDRTIDVGQKLKKKGDEKENGKEKKSSREILLHFPWFYYGDV